MPKEKQVPKKQVKKLNWVQNVYVVGYGRVFAGDPVTADQLKAVKEYNLDISKYLARHDVNILPNIYKEVSKTTSCDKAKCSALNELVMMKESGPQLKFVIKAP